MSEFNVLSDKINNAKTLDFGTVFGNCIDLFKKVWLQGLVVMILTGVLIFPVVLIIYIPMIALGIMSANTFGDSANLFGMEGIGVFAILAMVLLFLVVFVCAMTISIAMKAAYFRIVKNKDLELNQSEDYFFFLKRKYLKKSMVLGLMSVGIALVALLLFVIPFFYALIPLSYVTVVYALNPDLSASDTIKLSFKLGNKKWFLTFALVFVAWLLSTVVGFLMCFIGIYVTQQFINLPFYEVYKQSIGLDETNEIDRIGTN